MKQEGNKPQETEEMRISGCEAVTRGSLLGVTDHTTLVQLGEEEGSENPLMNVILVKRRHTAHAVPKEIRIYFQDQGPRPYQNKCCHNLETLLDKTQKNKQTATKNPPKQKPNPNQTNPNIPTSQSMRFLPSVPIKPFSFKISR